MGSSQRRRMMIACWMMALVVGRGAGWPIDRPIDLSNEIDPTTTITTPTTPNTEILRRGGGEGAAGGQDGDREAEAHRDLLRRRRQGGGQDVRTNKHRRLPGLPFRFVVAMWGLGLGLEWGWGEGVGGVECDAIRWMPPFPFVCVYLKNPPVLSISPSSSLSPSPYLTTHLSLLQPPPHPGHGSLHKLHDEAKDKPFELEMAWITEGNGWKTQTVARATMCVHSLFALRWFVVCVVCV